MEAQTRKGTGVHNIRSRRHNADLEDTQDLIGYGGEDIGLHGLPPLDAYAHWRERLVFGSAIASDPRMTPLGTGNPPDVVCNINSLSQLQKMDNQNIDQTQAGRFTRCRDYPPLDA